MRTNFGLGRGGVTNPPRYPPLVCASEAKGIAARSTREVRRSIIFANGEGHSQFAASCFIRMGTRRSRRSQDRCILASACRATASASCIRMHEYKATLCWRKTRVRQTLPATASGTARRLRYNHFRRTGGYYWKGDFRTHDSGGQWGLFRLYRRSQPRWRVAISWPTQRAISAERPTASTGSKPFDVGILGLAAQRNETEFVEHQQSFRCSRDFKPVKK